MVCRPCVVPLGQIQQPLPGERFGLAGQIADALRLLSVELLVHKPPQQWRPNSSIFRALPSRPPSFCSVSPSRDGRSFMSEKDAFDLWWEWAEKPLKSPLTISAGIPRRGDGALSGRPARPGDGQRSRPPRSDGAGTIDFRGGRRGFVKRWFPRIMLACDRGRSDGESLSEAEALSGMRQADEASLCVGRGRTGAIPLRRLRRSGSHVISRGAGLAEQPAAAAGEVSRLPVAASQLTPIRGMLWQARLDQCPPCSEKG